MSLGGLLEIRSSNKYNLNEYVLLTYGGKSDSDSKVLEHEKKEDWPQVMWKEMVS